MRILIFAVSISLATLSWGRGGGPGGPGPGPGGPGPQGQGGPPPQGGQPQFIQPGQQQQPPPPGQSQPQQQPAPIQIIQNQYYQEPAPRKAPSGPPGKARMTEFKDTFETMVEEYVEAHTRGGFFVIKPENSEVSLHLSGDGSGPKDVHTTPEGEAVGDVAFTAGDKPVTLEFHAKSDGWDWNVSRVLLSKLGDKRFLSKTTEPKRTARPSATTETEAIQAPAKTSNALLAVDMPPKTSMSVDPEAYAVVIGIEKYRDVPKVDFAARDSQTMYEYLTQSMGYDPKNVALLQNDRAGLADLETYLGPWLSDRVTAKSKVMVYYAGHGAPNPTTGEGYLIPYDGNPTYVETKAFPIKQLYANLAKLPSKDVTVVLDACFSGAGGRSVLAAGARPLVNMKTATASDIGSNTVVLTAARGDQISTYDPDGRHGLLTYHLLEALRGGADAKKDGKITMQEIVDYVGPAVERAARLQHVEQTPTVLPPAIGPRGREVWIKTK